MPLAQQILPQVNTGAGNTYPSLNPEITMCSDGIELWFLSELHQYNLGLASNVTNP